MHLIDNILKLKIHETYQSNQFNYTTIFFLFKKQRRGFSPLKPFMAPDWECPHGYPQWL
jgi:hypothetical protein